MKIMKRFLITSLLLQLFRKKELITLGLKNNILNGLYKLIDMLIKLMILFIKYRRNNSMPRLLMKMIKAGLILLLI